MWPPEAFQARFTPQAYDDLVDSYDLDPPAEGVLRLTNGLLADLIASYRNVNFVDANKEHLTLTARDILPKEADDGDDEDDADEAPAGEAEAARVFAARDNLRSGLGLPGERRSMPLIPRPHATPVPAGLFAMLLGEGGDTEGDDQGDGNG